MTAPRPGGSVARALPGILACMIARRGRPRFRVWIEVPRTGSVRAWGAVAGDFERWLAEQVSPLVSEARVESETRRGPDSVRVRVAVTTRAANVGHAAVIAWDVFRTAAGEDIAAWDIAAASAEIQPAGKAGLTVRRVVRGDHVRRQPPADRHLVALPPRTRADLEPPSEQFLEATVERIAGNPIPSVRFVGEGLAQMAKGAVGLGRLLRDISRPPR